MWLITPQDVCILVVCGAGFNGWNHFWAFRWVFCEMQFVFGKLVISKMCRSLGRQRQRDKLNWGSKLLPERMWCVSALSSLRRRHQKWSTRQLRVSSRPSILLLERCEISPHAMTIFDFVFERSAETSKELPIFHLFWVWLVATSLHSFYYGLHDTAALSFVIGVLSETSRGQIIVF